MLVVKYLMSMYDYNCMLINISMTPINLPIYCTHSQYSFHCNNNCYIGPKFLNNVKFCSKQVKIISLLVSIIPNLHNGIHTFAIAHVSMHHSVNLTLFSNLEL